MKKLLLALLIIVAISLTGCSEDDLSNLNIEFTLTSGNDTVEINSIWEDNGAILSNGTFSLTVYASTTPYTSSLGLKEANYTVVFEETTYSLTRYIVVQDKIKPELQLIAGIDTITIGDTWIDKGIIVTDNSLEVITYTTSGTVNSNLAGTYTITYTATDSSGNTSTVLRYVTVIE